jgi:pyridoxamine 5'-phosphate oxidase
MQDMFSDSGIHQLRREYQREPLDAESFPADPVVQFQAWFEEARNAGILEPNAMTLGTAESSGRVSCRTVLLKGIDDRGFVFFTNYTSRKARQIGENAYASLLFPWIALERQVEVAGPVEKISEADSLEYFLSRPLGSRIGAWVSEQFCDSLALVFWFPVSRNSKNALQMATCRNREDGGYRVVPESIEFWQGGPDRLHDRVLYSRSEAGWKISRLSP